MKGDSCKDAKEKSQQSTKMKESKDEGEEIRGDSTNTGSKEHVVKVNRHRLDEKKYAIE